MKWIISSQLVFGMANLYPKHTGLPVVIWIDNLGSDRNVKHWETVRQWVIKTMIC